MGPIPAGGVVAVTGAAGYIGGWTVRYLLDRGYRVRACVRKADDPKTDFLKALGGYASGRLTLWEADLNNPGCFNDAFKGAHGVAHISHISGYNDEDYIRRTCTHIIESVNASDTVNRVVVTSSTAAIMSEMDLQELVRRPVIFEDRWPDELNPKRTPERGQGYSIGKVLAERMFASAAEESSGRWDSIACCPGDNVGPIQSAHQKERGAWQSQIAGMLAGRAMQSGVYRPWMTVDVRDNALCHIGLLESTSVRNGERYMACSTERRTVEDIVTSIDRLLPELRLAGATITDMQNERIKAREAEYRAIWAGTQVRNDRIRAATGVDFRPLDESIRDCVESLISIGGIKVKQREDAKAEAIAQ